MDIHRCEEKAKPNDRPLQADAAYIIGVIVGILISMAFVLLLLWSIP